NVDTGAVVMGPLELDNLTSDNSQTMDFTDDWTLNAGETVNLAVVADVDDGVATAVAFGVTLDLSAAASGSWFEDTNGDALAATAIVPSGDLLGYNQTARTASLTITLASTPGDVTSVDGTDDVLVQAFSFVAGTASDLHVSSIKVTAYADDTTGGSFNVTTAGDAGPTAAGDTLDLNDFIESCYLTDGNGEMIGTSAALTSDGVSFTVDDADWDIAAGASETLKIYCSFANPSDTTDTNWFSFDLNDVSEDIVVEDENSNDVDPTSDDPNDCDATCDNAVQLVYAGTIAAAVGASTPTHDFILTSSSDNHVATYRFTATSEDFEIQTISFSEEEAEDDNEDTDNTGYANNISLVTITYPMADGTTGESSVAMVRNEANFTGMEIYVPVGTPSDIKVYVDVPLTDRDAGGSATSNEQIRMGWFVDNETSVTADSNDNFKAVGLGSGTSYTDTDSDGSGTDFTALGIAKSETVGTFTVREAKPTFSLSSSSPSGASVPGLIEVLRFNVAASSNEDVVLERLTFKVTSTDIGASNWNDCDTNAAVTAQIDDSELYFYNLTTSASTQLDTADTQWTKYDGTGDICTASTAADEPLGFISLWLPTRQVVPAGSTYTYSLKIDTTTASASSDDAIRVDLVTDPVLGSFSSPATDNQHTTAAITISATTLAVDNPEIFYIGDVLCMDEGDDGCGAVTADERVLVVDCTDAADDGLCDSGSLTVVRGYVNSTNQAFTPDAGDDIDFLPGALIWQDDGSTAEGTANQTRWGGYMVDNLDLIGGTLVF
ncbi:hypothetical protein HYS28_00895, partial [Candidatus Uhrbacteria bacterium]|nr:hypothetical protein [Candidatus Uhrbacteria bacterium]